MNTIEISDENDFIGMDFESFKEMILFFLEDKNPPGMNYFKKILIFTNTILQNENPEIRPKDSENLSGGIINITRFKNTVILPDLHARRNFLKIFLNFRIDESSIIEKLEKKEISFICLGDGVHSEGSASGYRWMKAFEEYKTGYASSKAMDDEIADSFNLMIAIMCLKIRYKDCFHFIKGNHENIYNETGNGNYAFAKYAIEGDMVLKYFRKFYDEETLGLYSYFEKNLPLFVLGKNFLASHSEPEFFFNMDQIINFRNNPDLIESLTWTDNYASVRGTVDQLLKYFLNKTELTSEYYFGGHRPIKDKYNRINNDRYVQIHNPQLQIAVIIDQDENIDLDKDVIVIPKKNQL
jgi:hypothetical protein